jgi:hypothetical protein
MTLKTSIIICDFITELTMLGRSLLFRSCWTYNKLAYYLTTVITLVKNYMIDTGIVKKFFFGKTMKGANLELK